jgi:hypothetical protein
MPHNGLLGASAGPPQIIRQSITDSFIYYGKRRTIFLKMVFYHPKKVGSRHYRYFVYAVAGHRCQGVVQWLLNDEVVTVDAGAVTSGKYAGKAWLWFQRGLASETANATFVSECDGKWTADHKGNGVAAIYAKFEMTDEVVEAGFATPSAVIEGKDDIRDPRDDSEGYQNNAALVFYDWMAIPREEGGFGAYPDEIPDDAWISSQANVCDEDVTIEGGSEKRYALDGIVVTGASPADIRDSLVVNCAGSFTYAGGKFLMRPGYWVPPSETLSEDDLSGPITVSPFMTGDVTANRVEGTFVDPAANYLGAPFAAKELPDVTDIRQMDLDLGWITSKYRAERVANIMLLRAAAEKTVTWPMNIAGLKVQALDTVHLGTSRYGLSNYAFTVTNWGMSADFGVVLSLREENEEIYADPAEVAVAAPPSIATPETIVTDSELVSLVSTSFVTDADPADGLLQGTDTTITIEAHTRTYNDKAVSVTGGALTGLTAETVYHVYYDDADRAGGTVTYTATTNPQDAATSPAFPDRHYVGSLSTDVSGGTGTSGGGSSPPGWGGGDWNTPIP